MPAPVVGDAAISARSQEDHLVFPVIGTEGPSVIKDHGLPRTPVLLVDVCAIRGGNCRHRFPPYVMVRAGLRAGMMEIRNS